MWNEYTRGSLEILDMKHKIEEKAMSWLGFIVRRDEKDINIRQYKVGGRVKGKNT